MRDGGDGLDLVLEWLGSGFALGLREDGEVGGIVQRGTLEVGQQKADDGFFLRVADLPGVAADAVGGGDQQAVFDARPVGFAEEFIDIVFGDVVVGRIALGLHRPVFAVLVAEHQIDAAVRAPAFRPFFPQPNLVNLGSPFRIGLEEPFDEVLELLAALGWVSV